MYDIITSTSTISQTLLAFISIFLFRKQPRELKVLSIFLITACLIEWAGFFMSKYGIHNLSLYNILTLLEYLVTAYLLFKWAGGYMHRFLIIISVIGFTAVWIYTSIYVVPFVQYNNYVRMLQSFLTLAFAGWLLLDVSDFTKKSMLYDARFWLGTSWVLYFAVSVVIFVLSGWLISKSGPSFYIAWVVKSFANIAGNILYGIAIICSSQKQKL